MVDVSQLGQHTVNVQTLNEHPGESAHVEVVEEDGYYGTHKLEGKGQYGGKNKQKKGKVNRLLKLNYFIILIPAFTLPHIGSKM